MVDIEFIQNKFNRLRNSEQKVAKIVLDDPDKVIHASISELAERAGVSDPTVIRFCRSLGFTGYQEFKIHLAQSLIPKIHSIHEALDGSENTTALTAKVFSTNEMAIKNSLNSLDIKELDTVIKLVSKCGKIIFHGVGGSAVVAKDAYHKFFRIGLDCQWMEDTHMALMAASMMSKNDVFFAISHSGSTKDIYDCLKAANEAGATTVALVTAKSSPISKIALHTLRVYSAETNFKFEPMSSRIAQLSVIDVLAVGVSLLRSGEVLENLHKTRKVVAGKRF